MAQLNRTMMKCIIGNKNAKKDITLEDLQDYDPSIYKSVKYIA
jgi:hypothetical protein